MSGTVELLRHGGDKVTCIYLVRVKIIYLQVKKKSRHVASFFLKWGGEGGHKGPNSSKKILASKKRESYNF